MRAHHSEKMPCFVTTVAEDVELLLRHAAGPNCINVCARRRAAVELLTTALAVLARVFLKLNSEPSVLQTHLLTTAKELHPDWLKESITCLFANARY